MCLQGCFRLVFESLLHSGAQGYSKVYARRTLAPVSLLSSLFVGSNPTVRQKRIASWFGFVLRDTKNGTLNCVRERFVLRLVIIRQREKRLGASFGAMQKRALPENGYRVIPIGAKRVLSAPCRKYLSFQPLLLHE